jgi:WD40 repeat protein
MPQNLLAWSKHTSCFSVLGSDVRVYELVRGKPSLVSICSDIQQGRCVDFTHDTHQPLRAAVGTVSGGIACCNFATQPGNVDKMLLQRRSQEPCNAIAWNPKKWHQLAAGFQKGSKGSQKRASTMLLDASQMPSGNRGALRNQHGIVGSQQRDVFTKPLRLFTDTEGTASLAWKPDDPSCLVVGTTSKWLRAYDTRSSSNSPVVSISAHTKSVLGATFSECQPNMLLTYSEDSIVKVWDMRTIVGGAAVATVDTNEKEYYSPKKTKHMQHQQQSTSMLLGKLSMAGIIEGGGRGHGGSNARYGGTDYIGGIGDRGGGAGAVPKSGSNGNGGTFGSTRSGISGSSGGSSRLSSGTSGTFGFGNEKLVFDSDHNNNNNSSNATSGGGLVGVRWSPNHNYQFATASAHSGCISLWNIAHGTAAVARQRGQSIGSMLDHPQGSEHSGHNGMTPIRRRFASSKIVSFVFQRGNDVSRPTVERVLVATHGGHLEDMAMYDHMPLTINVHGSLTWGAERKVVSMIKQKDIDTHEKSPQPPRPPQPMKSSTVDEMASRAKRGYSLNAGPNVAMLESTHRTSINSSRGLIDAWCSIDRATSIQKESVLRRGLAATLSLNDTFSVTTKIRDVLGFKTYLSKNRVTALRLCGWLVAENELKGAGNNIGKNKCGRSSGGGGGGSGGGGGGGSIERRGIKNSSSFSLENNQNNVGSFESGLSSFSSSSSSSPASSSASSSLLLGSSLPPRLSEDELRRYIQHMSIKGSRCRAAALAVFHGSIAISVEVLQKAAAESIKGSIAYELLSLVTMTVAGFPVESRDPKGSQKIWRDMASDLCGKLWEAAKAQKDRMCSGVSGGDGAGYNHVSGNISSLSVSKNTLVEGGREDGTKGRHSRNDSTISCSDSRTLSSRSILYLRALLSFLCSPAGWATPMKRGLGAKTYFRQIDQRVGGGGGDTSNGSNTTIFNGYEGLLDPSSAFDYEGKSSFSPFICFLV